MKTITLCGLGHSTHGFIPRLPLDYKINVLTTNTSSLSYNNMTSNLNGNREFTVHIDPKIVKDSKFILMSLPAIAYDTYMELLGPYLTKDHVLIITPGQGGFLESFKKYCDIDLNIIYTLPLAMNCRIEKFGTSVNVTTYKSNFIISSDLSISTSIKEELGYILNANNILNVEGGSILADLMPINPVIHTCRLYNLINTNNSLSFDREVLFYEEMTQQDIDLMESLEKELMDIGYVFDVKIPCLRGFLMEFVYESKHDNLLDFFTKEDAYKGYKVPMLSSSENKYIINLDDRYKTEDVDRGLKLYKTYANLAKVSTPTLDKLITFFNNL